MGDERAIYTPSSGACGDECNCNDDCECDKNLEKFSDRTFKRSMLINKSKKNIAPEKMPGNITAMSTKVDSEHSNFTRH